MAFIIKFTAHGEPVTQWGGYANRADARAALRDADLLIPFHWEHEVIEDATVTATPTTHANITTAFFAAIGTKARDLITTNIANHYGITSAEALAEVTSPAAECLLDYVTGPERAATHVLMQRHGINPFVGA